MLEKFLCVIAILIIIWLIIKIVNTAFEKK